MSALVHGGDNVGYLVARRPWNSRSRRHGAGVAMVGANSTWYTGMLSYYAERLAGHDLVSMIASNASPWVAPFGGTEGRFGTNPICYGFPTAKGDPIIWDIGTSTIMHAEILLARRLGKELPEGVAFGPDGRPTRDPAATLDGGANPGLGRGQGLRTRHRRAALGRHVRLAADAAGHARLRLPVRRHEPGSADAGRGVQDQRQGVCRGRALDTTGRGRFACAHALRPLSCRAAQAHRQPTCIEVPDLLLAQLTDIAGPGPAGAVS